jgi:hypothetical protein
MARADPGRSIEPFWEPVKTETLAQGDFLTTCSVPVVPPDFATSIGRTSPVRVRVDVLDLIIMTQSCDLENSKAPLVACCPIHTLARFEEFNPKLKKTGGMGECETRSARGTPHPRIADEAG